MQFTILRSSSEYKLIIKSDDKTHTFDLSKMTRNELDGVRELVVDQWAHLYGFEPVYSAL